MPKTPLKSPLVQGGTKVESSPSRPRGDERGIESSLVQGGDESRIESHLSRGMKEESSLLTHDWRRLKSARSLLKIEG